MFCSLGGREGGTENLELSFEDRFIDDGRTDRETDGHDNYNDLLTKVKEQVQK